MNLTEIKTRPISIIDYAFLYKMLKERNDNINISHKTMPSYEKHVIYWYTTPFIESDIILYKKTPIGYYYISKKSEIGIFLLKEYQKQGIGTYVLENIIGEYRGRKIYANINPRNKISKNMFVKLGFIHIQNTYIKILEDATQEKNS